MTTERLRIRLAKYTRARGNRFSPLPSRRVAWPRNFARARVYFARPSIGAIAKIRDLSQCLCCCLLFFCSRVVGWWRRLLSQSIKKPLTCDHLFPLVGPHAVLVRRVLDFSFHHTDYNSSLGLPLQNVSGSFLCRFLVVFIFTISVLTGHSNLFLNYFINVYFVFFRFRRTFYKTLKEQIQEVEVEHVSSHFPAVAFPSRSPRFFLPGSPRSHIAFTLCSLFF